MASSTSRLRGPTPMASVHSTLQSLQGELLALISVAAGLKASLTLSTCCAGLAAALGSPLMDEQLFGRLYASLAGVDNPGDAFLHPRSPPCGSYFHRKAPSWSAHCSAANVHHQGAGKCSCFLPKPRLLPVETEQDTSRRRQCRGRCAPDDAAIPEWHFTPGDNVSDSPPGLERLSEGVDCVPDRPLSDDEGRVSRRGESLSLIADGETWKARLKRDLATGREPSGTLLFSAHRIGRQDVLMGVIPSNPPVIAVTCTTELSLFKLDGTRLPAVTVSGDTISENLPGERKHDASAFSRVAHADEQGELAAEAHKRDIRCLAVSPAGDMVATGSLDCTIRVRSVPESDWVRRLRGHEAGVRCLVFHHTRRLVSADSLGVISIWDVFPVTRRLQTVQGHSDSVQVLTWTGGGERLASGALDGSVVIWSASPEGTLNPVFSHGGFCHPYRLVAVGRCVAFTSSSSPGVGAGAPSGLVVCDDSFGEPNSGGDTLPLSASKGSHISVVGVSGGRGKRLPTGQARVHHLAAGACVGTVMASPAEPWACKSEDSSSDEEDEAPLPAEGMSSLDYSPRLCHIRAASTQECEAVHGDFDVGGGLGRRVCTTGRRKTKGHSEEFASDWGKMTQDRASPSTRSMNVEHNYGEDLEGGSGGALCTCAAFVGRTVFLGYDTGGVWAHRVSDGRRLYRLSTRGPPVHLVEAGGSLFAYDSSGAVSRWTWGDH